MVAKRSNVLATVSLLLLLLCAFSIQSAFSQEPPLYQIYNTIYGTSLVSNQDLENTYGLACSDTFDPCTQDGDCLTGTCDPIDDGFWLETNGYVSASARYAGYTQRFGYYTDACVASEQVELFNVPPTATSAGMM